MLADSRNERAATRRMLGTDRRLQLGESIGLPLVRSLLMLGAGRKEVGCAMGREPAVLHEVVDDRLKNLDGHQRGFRSRHHSRLVEAAPVGQRTGIHMLPWAAF